MLKLKEVVKYYGAEPALKNLSLEINKSGLYLFVGENGSGKSTALKLLAGLIYSSSGSKEFINKARKISYMPPMSHYPRLLKTTTYLQYLLNGIVKPPTIRNYMEKYSLPNKMIGSLSKGMIGKLGLIQTIINPSDLYLFDEPDNGLDEEALLVFKGDLDNLIKTQKTVIIATHTPILYAELNPDIYYFKDGKCNV